MGSLAGKSPANTYKSLLKVADETNGVTGTISRVEDGEGTESSLQLSSSQTRVKPNNDTTLTFAVKKNNGDSLLVVDSSNDLVKVGTSQVSATTQLLTFNAYRIVPASAGTHYFVGLPTGEYQSHNVEISNGTGTDPSVSKDAGTTTQYLANFIFPVPYNITIDACKALISTHSDTDSTINVHLNSFDMVNDGTTNDGNLTNGTVLADGQATSVDRSVIKTLDCTIQSSSVTSGKVIACFVENVTDTNYINIQVQVKYHIA
jgi:hypothetical protein